jgi:hypothetical protein
MERDFLIQGKGDMKNNRKDFSPKEAARKVLSLNKKELDPQLAATGTIKAG